MPKAFDNEEVSSVSGMRCLTTLLKTGVRFYGLLRPQSRSMQFHASISPSHLALRGDLFIHPLHCAALAAADHSLTCLAMFHLLLCMIRDFRRHPECKGISYRQAILGATAENFSRLRRAESFLLLRLQRA